MAGGARDPNLHAVLDAARARGVEVLAALAGAGENPSLTWDLGSDALVLDGKAVKVTSAFLRFDVFHGGGPDAKYRASAWHATLEGWLASCPRVRTLNRCYLGRYTNKLHALRMARAAGLVAPPTLATNAVDRLKESPWGKAAVAKPVPGGGYCKPLEELLAGVKTRDGIAAVPAIVQPRLPGADVRVYGIRGTYAGFRIQGDTVDYRESARRDIAPMDDIPRTALDGLERLMEGMGLDWCAADFKACPDSGSLTFLEINSNPMFAAFDRVGGGTITRAIVNFLTSR